MHTLAPVYGSGEPLKKLPADPKTLFGAVEMGVDKLAAMAQSGQRAALVMIMRKDHAC